VQTAVAISSLGKGLGEQTRDQIRLNRFSPSVDYLSKLDRKARKRGF